MKYYDPGVGLFFTLQFFKMKIYASVGVKRKCRVTVETVMIKESISDQKEKVKQDDIVTNTRTYLLGIQLQISLC